MIPFRKICILTTAILTGICYFAAADVSDNRHKEHKSFITRPSSAEKEPDSNGFIQRWLILEPIPSVGLTDSAVRAAVKKEYFPGQFAAVPRDGDQVTVGENILTWHAVDTGEYNVNLYYFARDLGKSASNVLFWAVTVVDCREEMHDMRLAIGSNAASVWWVNGREVIGIYNDRQTVIDDGVSKRLTLKKGRNIIRGAVINGGGAADFCARFLDGNDKPFRDFTVTITAAGIMEDGVNADRYASDYRKTYRVVSKKDSLTLKMAPNRGWAAILTLKN